MCIGKTVAAPEEDEEEEEEEESADKGGEQAGGAGGGHEDRPESPPASSSAGAVHVWNPEGWPCDGPALLLLVTRGLEDLAAAMLDQGFEPVAGCGVQRPTDAETRAPLPPLRARLMALPLPARVACDAHAGAPETFVPFPQGETGEAAVGKLLLRLDGLTSAERKAVILRVQRTPVIQGALACVAVATGVQGVGCRRGLATETTFEGALAQIRDVVAEASRWVWARALLVETAEAEPIAAAAADESAAEEAVDVAIGACGPETTALLSEDLDKKSSAMQEAAGAWAKAFRASCVRDGAAHKGYRSQDVMAAIGSGAWKANPSWSVSVHNYDVEVLGFLSDDVFACGLWLGGEWRVNNRGEVRNGQDRHYNVVPLGDRRPYLAQSVPHLPRLRPSTGLLMTLLGEPRAGEVLLDPFGGVGTIALEAACHFDGLACISSDKDVSAYHVASQHCAGARKAGNLRPGSSAKSRHWDARRLKLADASVDLVVSDLPFLNKCSFRDGSATEGTSARAGLSAVLRELGRVLRAERSGCGGPGRAVLLVQSRKLLLDSLVLGHGCQLELASAVSPSSPNPRPVVIGGFACWVFVLHRRRELRDGNPDPQPQQDLSPLNNGRCVAGISVP